MNYLDYFKDGGVSHWPLPDTVYVNNKLLKESPTIGVDYGPITVNSVKYVGKKLVEANNTLDNKMERINSAITDLGSWLDMRFGITRRSNSPYLDSNWDINRFTYNKSRS